MADNREFYLGNQRLKRVNVPVNYTKEQVKEFVKCSKDPKYFISKYVKIINVDKGLMPFKMWPFQRDMVDTAISNRFSIFKLSRQVGKALDIETDIPTTSGWKKMKDIAVGDIVFDMYGRPTTVTFKSEIHNKPTYKITFSDNTTVVCCEDHLWYGYDNRSINREELRTFTTKQVVEEGVKLYNSKFENRYAIPLTEAVDYEEKTLPIDPYVLGLWLGDGSSDDGTLTILEDDFEDIKHLIPYECTTRRYDKRNLKILNVKIHGLLDKLKLFNLYKNKHIPDLYMQSSITQRRALLAGLLDTDGTVSNYSVSFTQAAFRYNLVNQVRELISSLGYKVGEYHYKETKFPSITIRFISYDISNFCLNRKKNKQKIASTSKSRKKQIVNIELVETTPTQCIQVDSPTHTFLCTRDYTVTHNTQIASSIILWYILFHENYSVAILANKLAQAREILGRLQLSYENLPKWLQQGIVEWNKTNITLENGSKVLSAATSSSAIRGTSQNLIYLDEFAFVPAHIQGEFFASVYPTISSGNTTKVIVTSTPKGLNIFYKLWSDAENGKNSFVPFHAHWSDVPGRDQKWREETIKNTSEQQFREEYETEFIGSTNTLISPSKLLALAGAVPMKGNDDYAMYEDPTLQENKKNLYILVADTARGIGGDYSAFVVYNVTTMPYKVVATYKNNTITPLLFPNVINQFARLYNNAYVCVEVNDVGQQIADILYRELEYEHMVFTQMRGRQGQQLSQGFGGTALSLGVRTTKQVKRIGCTNFKAMVEADQLIIEDTNIINELYTFVESGESYAAEEGSHDDLAMCCVIFAWLTMQSYFKEWTDTNLRESLRSENLKLIEDELLSFDIDDGFDVGVTTEIRSMSASSFDRWMLE